MTRACIDVGSNSVLLLVSRLTNGQWLPVFEWSDVTGLGRDTKRTGLIQSDGMATTLAALKRGFNDARDHGADQIVAGGTMALRIAKNAPEFMTAAEAQGTPVRLVSGEEEAELGFLAVANDPMFKEYPVISIIDPGGHSTELVTAERILHQPAGAVNAVASWKTQFRQSYPVGALGLLEGVLAAESPSGPDQLRAATEIDAVLGMEYIPHVSGHAVTLGATGTNLISIREKLAVWDPAKVHGQWLDFEEISKAGAWLMNMSLAERAALVGMEKGRERTIHIGSLILERFLMAIHVLGCSVSTRGWRYAMLEDDRYFR